MEKTINCIVKINRFALAVIIFINGIDQPPKNNKVDKTDIKIILEYSPKKNIAKVNAEYSTL
jgi:hypothetical protein